MDKRHTKEEFINKLERNKRKRRGKNKLVQFYYFIMRNRLIIMPIISIVLLAEAYFSFNIRIFASSLILIGIFQVIILRDVIVEKNKLKNKKKEVR